MLLRTCALALAVAVPLLADDEPSVNAAMQLAMKGDLPGALATLDKVLAAHPQDAHAFHQRALAYYAMGKFDPALADVSKALELDPKLIAAVRTRGAILCRSSRPKEALADFDRLAELHPGDGAACIGRMACYIALGDFDSSVEDYRTALGTSDSAEGFRRLLAARLGLTFLRPDGEVHPAQPTSSLDDAEELLSGAPDVVWPVLPAPAEAREIATMEEKTAHDAGDKSKEVRAAVLVGRAIEEPMSLAKLKKEEQQDHLRDARSAYLRAIDADKGNPAGYVAWAQSFLRSYAWKKAGKDPFGGALDYLSETQDLLETALKECGDEPEPHRLLGFVFEEKGNLDSAVEHYEKAIALAPSDPLAHGSLAGLYLRRKNDSEKAIDALNRCLKACPSDAESKLALAFVLLQAGRKDEALAATRAVFPSVALTHPVDPDGDLAQLLRGVGLLPEK